MFGKAKTSPVKHSLETRMHHNPFFPSLALRRRSHEHPMAMFAMLAAVSLGSMALIPTTGPQLVSRGETVKPATFVDNAKGARLAPQSKTNIACQGQAWGSEDEECLLVIVRESGRKETRQIRLIASAEPDANRPNVF